MQDHPYYNEVKFAIELLNTKGFVPIGFDDGDGVLNTTKDINSIIEGVLSVGESWVECEHVDKHVGFLFVLGNEPGVAINDYTTTNTELDMVVDSIVEEVYNHFNQ